MPGVRPNAGFVRDGAASALSKGDVELHISLHYKASSSLGKRADCRDYILDLTANVTGYANLGGEHPQSREIKLGELRLFLIRLGNAIRAHADRYSLFDTYGETEEAGVALFEPSFTNFQAAVQRQFPGASPDSDILLLHHLTFQPFARKQRLGLSVLRRAMCDWSSGCSLVIIKPFTLEQSGTAEEAEWAAPHPARSRAAYTLLRKHYEELGFDRIGRTDFYALCPTESLVSVHDLQLPDSVRLPYSIVQHLPAV